MERPDLALRQCIWVAFIIQFNKAMVMNRIVSLRFFPLASIAFAAAAAAQTFSPPPIVASSAPASSTAADDASTRGMTAERRWQTDALRDAQDPTLERQKSPRKGAAAHPAKAEDLVVGAAIADKTGIEIGTIRGVEADGVVVATATGLIKIPAESLGKNGNGLLIGMTKADFDKVVAQSAGG